MPRIDSPVRRVLADKPANASIKSHKGTITWKNPASSRDSLSISFGDTTRSPKTSHTFKSPRVGQKRRIEEVEDAERNESQQSADTQRLSQATDLLSDGSLDMMVDSTTNTRSTAQTSLTSFHASQAEPESAEAQFEFEIHEEMSQRTLDKMHEISLPQNTSQPAPLLRPNLLKETSQLCVSMSSLIDFDGDKSQDHSDGLQMLEPGANTASNQVRARSEEETRRDTLSEKAETLRTRLQLALFKVQTNQTSKPFSRLNQPRTRPPELPPQLSSSPLSSPPERHAHFTPMSPESKIAIARARATMQVKQRVPPLDAIGHPALMSTTFSARLVTEEPQIPSSPSLTNGADVGAPSLERVGTPTPPSKTKGRKQTAMPRTPMQLSSPPGSPEMKLKTTAVKLRKGQGNYGGLISSVLKKGVAANGLLELMRGAAANGEQ